MSEELARRAVACKHWRWLPGMLAERWTGPCHGTYRYSDHDVRAHRWWPGGLPVFNDPATLGCLLALVREAWGAVIVRPPEDAPQVTGWWEVEALPDGPAWGARTEAAALVAALEAAP